MVNLLILPFSLIGLFISWHIYHKKHHKKEKLVCIIGRDCDRVIHSKYSKFLGIHLEVLGMIYYGGLSLLVVLTNVGVLNLFGYSIFAAVFLLSTAAFFISLILIYIQAFVLKEWCEYCLISALMSTIIFLIELF